MVRCMSPFQFFLRDLMAALLLMLTGVFTALGVRDEASTLGSIFAVGCATVCALTAVFLIGRRD